MHLSPILSEVAVPGISLMVAQSLQAEARKWRLPLCVYEYAPHSEH